MYHFAGANIPVCGGSTTTEGFEDDCKLVLRRENGKGRFSRAEKSRLEELGVVKVLAVKTLTGV